MNQCKDKISWACTYRQSLDPPFWGDRKPLESLFFSLNNPKFFSFKIETEALRLEKYTQSVFLSQIRNKRQLKKTDTYPDPPLPFVKVWPWAIPHNLFSLSLPLYSISFIGQRWFWALPVSFYFLSLKLLPFQPNDPPCCLRPWVAENTFYIVRNPEQKYRIIL